MLPLVPILVLAYAALYAFAQPLPSAARVSLRDAVGPAVPAAGVSIAPLRAQDDGPHTKVVGELGMEGKSAMDTHGVVSLVTGEGQGYYHQRESYGA